MPTVHSCQEIGEPATRITERRVCACVLRVRRICEDTDVVCVVPDTGFGSRFRRMPRSQRRCCRVGLSREGDFGVADRPGAPFLRSRSGWTLKPGQTLRPFGWRELPTFHFTRVLHWSSGWPPEHHRQGSEPDQRSAGFTRYGQAATPNGIASAIFARAETARQAE